MHELVRDGDRIVGGRYRTFGEEKGKPCGRARLSCWQTGQFTQSEEMLKPSICPSSSTSATPGSSTPNDDGAGPPARPEAAGGVLKHMDGALINLLDLSARESHIKGILVNKEGQRYVAEDSYHSRARASLPRSRPIQTGYLIVDDSIYTGESPGVGGYPVVDAWESFAEMEKGLGMPEGSLQETVRSYNEHAVKGEDPEFHKGKKWLKPLDVPPFAALDGRPGTSPYMCFTLGGLDVSIDGEVIGADGGTIAGLYAVGACASNIAQDGTGYSSGTCLGESTYFGRRAGRHVAGA